MTAHHKRTGDLAVQVAATTAAILLIAVEPTVARVLLTVLLVAAIAVAALVVLGSVELAILACMRAWFGWRARRRAARRAGYIYGGPR